mmetsp:Transcript_42957/g.110929  ORF Transcript_42957/g.110929 Transcript_42957/m.110929 type:complete len:205 (-) Transcript_42957:3179-3793(-)
MSHQERARASSRFACYIFILLLFVVSLLLFLLLTKRRPGSSLFPPVLPTPPRNRKPVHPLSLHRQKKHLEDQTSPLIERKCVGIPPLPPLPPPFPQVRPGPFSVPTPASPWALSCINTRFVDMGSVHCGRRSKRELCAKTFVISSRTMVRSTKKRRSRTSSLHLAGTSGNTPLRLWRIIWQMPVGGNGEKRNSLTVREGNQVDR